MINHLASKKGTQCPTKAQLSKHLRRPILSGIEKGKKAY
jgi:hypothetical protein